MKKYPFFLSALLLGACVITSCSNDPANEPEPTPVPVPEPEPVVPTAGVYVVCSGNQSSQIDGSLTYFNLQTTTPSLVADAFTQANRRSLGMTANDAVVYGSKLYVVVDAENTIEVADAMTQKSLRQLKTTELLGETQGVSPRHIVARDGKVYVDTYGGYVAAIDTADYSLVRSYQVGSYPEGMAFMDDTLYVANSNYGMGLAPSISAIDLTTGNVTDIRHESINNPTTLAVAGGALYIADGDVYDPTTWEISKPGGLRRYKDGKAGSIMSGSTAMAANQIAAMGDSLFIISDAYTDQATLSILNAKANTVDAIQIQGLGNVNAIAVDPVTKTCWAACYIKQDGQEWTDYSAPGICLAFDFSGQPIPGYTFQTGVGPTAIIFNHIRR